MDCNQPGSSIHDILQAEILEWVAISSSRGPPWPRAWTLVSWKSPELGVNSLLLSHKVKVKVAQSCPTLCDLMDSPCNSRSQNTGVGSHSLLQGVFRTQRSNPGLPRCRWILYQLSHQESPRILEWVADTFSGSSRSRNQTRVSCIAGRFFTRRGEH